MSSPFPDLGTRPEGQLAYRILDGTMECFPLPSDGIRPHQLVWRSATVGTLLPGVEHHQFWRHGLPRVVELSARVTPGVTWWCGPTLANGCRGQAFLKHDLIVLSSATAPRQLVHDAYHEAAHCCDNLCSDEEHRVWRDAAMSTMDWCDDHAYMDSQQERLANLFADVCLAGASGAEPFALPRSPLNEVLGRIYVGDVGKRRATLRQQVCAPVAPVRTTISARIAEWLHLPSVAEWLDVPAEA